MAYAERQNKMSKDDKPAMSKWNNKPRTDTTTEEERRRQTEAWTALNLFVTDYGGWVTTPPSARDIRIETPRGSEIPSKLRSLGFNVRHRGTGERLAFEGPFPVDISMVNLDGA